MRLDVGAKIFVIGGTGAQGLPVVRGLVHDKKYHVRVLTRDTSSQRAKALLALGNIELLAGSFANETTLREGFRNCEGAYVNIDGFNTGEKTEMYWAMRIYEIAIEQGIKFFVYGNLGYSLKMGNYDSKFRSGHLDGKGRVGEWIQWQTQQNRERMGAALFTTGPYIDMSLSAATVMSPTIEDGVVTWRVPVGNGAVPFIALQDCGYYVRWLFDNTDQSNGMELKVAIDHITFHELAAAFELVTGHRAQYIEMTMEEYWSRGHFPYIADLPAGYNADPNDQSTMSTKDNFTGFWNVFRYGLVKRDYDLLDEIYPNRIKSAKQWFELEDERGKQQKLGSLWDRIQPENIQKVLKRYEDPSPGIL